MEELKNTWISITSNDFEFFVRFDADDIVDNLLHLFRIGDVAYVCLGHYR